MRPSGADHLSFVLEPSVGTTFLASIPMSAPVKNEELSRIFRKSSRGLFPNPGLLEKFQN